MEHSVRCAIKSIRSLGPVEMFLFYKELFLFFTSYYFKVRTLEASEQPFNNEHTNGSGILPLLLSHTGWGITELSADGSAHYWTL